jgi:hypothetical protein
MLQMLARRDLRNDAAEGPMPLDLRCDQIDADSTVAVEQRNRSFIARRFNSEDHAASNL